MHRIVIDFASGFIETERLLPGAVFLTVGLLRGMGISPYFVECQSGGLVDWPTGHNHSLVAWSPG